METENLHNQNNLDDFVCLDIFDDDNFLTKRPTCDRCKRPTTVCWCPFLPCEPVKVETNLFILQHPFEESRCLRTVPILQNCISPEKCQVIIGKRFNYLRNPELKPVFDLPTTLLLYPGEDAIDITALPTDTSYTLVLLDGTWAQAKGIYSQNAILKTLKKVQIKIEEKSKYVIRTQPSDTSLSTLETAALAISTLEKKPHIYEVLTGPLVALCNFQIQHGASEHQSKEFRVENGLWPKPLRRSVQKRLAEKWEKEKSKSNS
ncbi:tRNA-uridine aminocarboxypropyltransferase 2-like [Physella acuta]|uniref:tRNA-uridine aminocarboxypropyltransferase 2-like n=1 Tax=Physella acuta TaxID=109671 RepID=UPI0027DD8ABA|nr:tRNA-uridine aminocarboxypropyltransferase 2-like [Physella acuta]